MRDSFVEFSLNTMEEILEASFVYPNGKGDMICFRTHLLPKQDEEQDPSIPINSSPK